MRQRQLVPSPFGQILEPLAPAAAYTTYQIAAPIQTHWRPATCAEIDCPAWLRGWETDVLPDSQEEATIKVAGRHWSRVEATPEGYRRYVFPGGQPCFEQGALGYPQTSKHLVPLEREEIFIRRAGDWRGNPLGVDPYVHARPEHWVEDFAEHQQSIAAAADRG